MRTASFSFWKAALTGSDTDVRCKRARAPKMLPARAARKIQQSAFPDLIALLLDDAGLRHFWFCWPT